MLQGLRSFIFWLVLTVWTLIVGFLGLVTFITMKSKIIAYVTYIWGLGAIFFMRFICGLDYQVSGIDTLPKKPFIVASKHQSMWETVFLLTVLGNPAFILKKELCKIPVYGWYLKPAGMISVDRSKASSVKDIARQVKNVFRDNRVLIIFPEGTRVPVGESVAYKPGIYAVHKDNPHIPIVPAAVNSGRFWKKNSCVISPGTVKLQFLPAITGEHSKEELLSKLKETIDSASNNL